MVKFYTYRLKEEPEEREKILIQDVPIQLNDADQFLVFVAGSMEVLGIYEKKGEHLIVKETVKYKKLSDLYSCFRMVSFVNERTYKMFAKRIREIEKEDMEKILDHC